MHTAAILSGGRARRFGGRDKSALVVGAERIIDRQIAVLHAVADRVLIVTNARDRHAGLGLAVFEDLRPGCGTLGGIYTALMASETEQTLIIACDMPFLRAPFLRHVLAAGRGTDIAVPRTRAGYEPLCASYARTCLGPIGRRLEAGALKVVDLLSEVGVREIGPEETAAYDPDGTMFFNINTPQDYARASLVVNREP
ncbi:MAG: molybdenum cofactor guanylyltransferase [Acidobacteria bacterium]|nr:molybdenum cofactor guanylyltransferase [Acidobacteriota bacterium]